MNHEMRKSTKGGMSRTNQGGGMRGGGIHRRSSLDSPSKKVKNLVDPEKSG